MIPRSSQDPTSFVGRRRTRAGLPTFLFVSLAMVVLVGCSGVSGIPKDPMGLQYEDRCYIEDSQFAFADQLYDRVGSLQLVEQELLNYYKWRPCEASEALYRLRKVHDLP